jgi:hypothetical protein
VARAAPIAHWEEAFDKGSVEFIAGVRIAAETKIPATDWN